MLTTENPHSINLDFVGPEGAVLVRSKGYAHRLRDSGEDVYYADDAHLFYVLCKWGNEYVVWLFNAKDSTCNEGSYHQDFETAYNIYLSRNL